MSASVKRADSGLAKGGQSANKRLQSELMQLMMGGSSDVSAFPQGDNLFKWIGTIKGAQGTVYAGLTYKLSLEFPADYPFTAPTVRFDTPCFHPNVDQYGNICLDILKDKWSAVQNVQSILVSIQSLLGEPNNDSPLNAFAAALWENQDEFRKHVIKKHEEFSQQTVAASTSNHK